MKEPIGLTAIVNSSEDPIAVYLDSSGLPTFETDAPYALTNGKSLESPIPAVDAGGPVWYDWAGHAVDAVPVTAVPNAVNLDPGPLDMVVETAGNITVGGLFDLATASMTLAVTMRYDGDLTSMTATHGGEALQLVRLDAADGVASAIFVGNDLTTESAEVVVTPVGATIGPAVMRMRDDWGPGEVAPTWNDGSAVTALRSAYLTPNTIAEPQKMLYARACAYLSGSNAVTKSGSDSELINGLVGNVMAGNFTTHDYVVQITTGWSQEGGSFIHDIYAPSPLGLRWDGITGNAGIKIVYSSERSFTARAYSDGGYQKLHSFPPGENLTSYIFVFKEGEIDKAGVSFTVGGNTTLHSVTCAENPLTLNAIIGATVDPVNAAFSISGYSSPAAPQAISAMTINRG